MALAALRQRRRAHAQYGDEDNGKSEAPQQEPTLLDTGAVV